MKHYHYEGPVCTYGNPVCAKWVGDTYAKTSRKALSNLTYQYKRYAGLELYVPVTFPGKLTVEE